MTRVPNASRTLTERLISEVDAALRAFAAPGPAARPAPGGESRPAVELSSEDRELSARLMRVNHAGEIAAQALYRGQALMANDERLRRDLLRAASEEHDHLVWCAGRVHELGHRVSLLSPLWYIGSLAIGAAAAMAGDRISLGFLAETERQVGQHLDGHLKRLPRDDHSSREILEQMRVDERRHQTEASSRGVTDLPLPARTAMRLASAVMTTVAFWI
jgi:ubiquinone biosynthesis monooxygenase Coq7